MSPINRPGIANHFYRVDRFIVPRAARDEFLEKVLMTHQLLREQPGFVQDFLLEQSIDADHVTLLTIAEWSDVKYVEGARAAVAAMHARIRFDKEEIFSRLGIKAEFASYRPL
jgi:hypothetical protein